MTSFTNDGSDVIHSPITVDKLWKTDISSLSEDFDVKQTVEWISVNSLKNIGLQFPDDLLHISVYVYELLKRSSDSAFYILGDTSFANCCVDEIVGKRVNIDAIIHYGRACMSKTTGTVPVLYVFGQIPQSLCFDSAEIELACQSLLEKLASDQALNCKRQPLLIAYDFRFKKIAQQFCEEMISLRNNDMFTVPPLFWSEPDVELPAQSTSNFAFCALYTGIRIPRCGRIFIHLQSDVPSAEFGKAPPWNLLYIGHGGSTTNEMLPFYRIMTSLPEVQHDKAFYYDPFSGQLNVAQVALKSLMKRRSYLIERAKDAQCVGILMSTLSIRNHKEIVERLQTLLKRAGRTYVQLMVGRLNATKLANIPGLDVIVLIACPETSLLDSRDFFVPIVTPFEMECALGALYESVNEIPTERLWTGEKYWVDFSDLLPGGRAYVPEQSIVPAITESSGNVSLITGKMSLLKATHEVDVITGNVIAIREPWDIVSSSQHNSGRTWYGLDPQIGQTSVATVKEGCIGLPIHYANEPTENHAN